MSDKKSHVRSEQFACRIFSGTVPVAEARRTDMSGRWMLVMRDSDHGVLFVTADVLLAIAGELDWMLVMRDSDHGVLFVTADVLRAIAGELDRLNGETNDT